MLAPAPRTRDRSGRAQTDSLSVSLSLSLSLSSFSACIAFHLQAKEIGKKCTDGYGLYTYGGRGIAFPPALSHSPRVIFATRDTYREKYAADVWRRLLLWRKCRRGESRFTCISAYVRPQEREERERERESIARKKFFRYIMQRFFLPLMIGAGKCAHQCYELKLRFFLCSKRDIYIFFNNAVEILEFQINYNI